MSMTITMANNSSLSTVFLYLNDTIDHVFVVDQSHDDVLNNSLYKDHHGNIDRDNLVHNIYRDVED